MKCGWSIFVYFLFLFSCAEPHQKESVNSNFSLGIPEGFPIPIIPKDNPFTPKKISLGKALFYEKLLSVDSSLSCASCHQPELAFSDSLSMSNGVKGNHTDRNAPSLRNVVFAPYLMRDGGPQNLELQILTPLESVNEMDLLIDDACDRLNSKSIYRKLFIDVFDTLATPFTLTRALACYERTLIGGNSKYDRWRYGDNTALDSIELAGMELFSSKRLGCANCHSGVLFTNYSFENNGTYEVYPDNGRFRVTARDKDIGKFKVPSLRNVAITSPYMFDGSFKTLNQVVDHYARGGKNHPNKSELVKPFKLTRQERSALIAFLNTLTEEKITD